MGNDRVASDKFLAGQRPIEDRLAVREAGEKGKVAMGRESESDIQDEVDLMMIFQTGAC